MDTGVLWPRGRWSNGVRVGGVGESNVPATHRTRPLCCEEPCLAGHP